MKKRSYIIFMAFGLFAESCFAVETKVIVEVKGVQITNIDVYERVMAQNHCLDKQCDFNSERIISEIALNILIDQYAMKENIANINRDTVLEHYDPNVKNITEEDIKKYIKESQRSYSLPEAIRCKSIEVSLEAINKDKTLLKSLKLIKSRLNNGEDFNDVVKEYSEKKEYVINADTNCWHCLRQADDFFNIIDIYAYKRKGMDALIPWSGCVGKAILVQTYNEMLVCKTIDYRPPVCKHVDKAINDKYLRDMVLTDLKRKKFKETWWRFICELECKGSEVKFTDKPEKIYQMLSEAYPQYIAELQNNNADTDKPER